MFKWGSNKSPASVSTNPPIPKDSIPSSTSTNLSDALNHPKNSSISSLLSSHSPPSETLSISSTSEQMLQEKTTKDSNEEPSPTRTWSRLLVRSLSKQKRASIVAKNPSTTSLDIVAEKTESAIPPQKPIEKSTMPPDSKFSDLVEFVNRDNPDTQGSAVNSKNIEPSPLKTGITVPREFDSEQKIPKNNKELPPRLPSPPTDSVSTNTDDPTTPLASKMRSVRNSEQTVSDNTTVFGDSRTSTTSGLSMNRINSLNGMSDYAEGEVSRSRWIYDYEEEDERNKDDNKNLTDVTDDDDHTVAGDDGASLHEVETIEDLNNVEIINKHRSNRVSVMDIEKLMQELDVSLNQLNKDAMELEMLENELKDNEVIENSYAIIEQLNQFNKFARHPNGSQRQFDNVSENSSLRQFDNVSISSSQKRFDNLSTSTSVMRVASNTKSKAFSVLGITDEQSEQLVEVEKKSQVGSKTYNNVLLEPEPELNIDNEQDNNDSNSTFLPTSGYLSKFYQKGVFKSWKRRYFILSPNRLYYFQSHESTGETLGSIPISDKSDCFVSTDVAFKGKHVFEIVSPTRNGMGAMKSVYLLCDKKEHMIEWVNGIRNVILSERAKGPTKTKDPQPVTRPGKISNNVLPPPPNANEILNNSPMLSPPDPSKNFTFERRTSNASVASSNSNPSILSLQRASPTHERVTSNPENLTQSNGMPFPSLHQNTYSQLSQVQLQQSAIAQLAQVQLQQNPITQLSQAQLNAIASVKRSSSMPTSTMGANGSPVLHNISDFNFVKPDNRNSTILSPPMSPYMAKSLYSNSPLRQNHMSESPILVPVSPPSLPLSAIPNRQGSLNIHPSLNINPLNVTNPNLIRSVSAHSPSTRLSFFDQIKSPIPSALALLDEIDANNAKSSTDRPSNN
ncbi:hypothetical protein HK098_008371 [Nowakowskiella sp. JEL0407]|nr:hypothetical protein HK098_008371 [Nowakowskiella sp. JEL0407]